MWKRSTSIDDVLEIVLQRLILLQSDLGELVGRLDIRQVTVREKLIAITANTGTVTLGGGDRDQLGQILLQQDQIEQKRHELENLDILTSILPNLTPCQDADDHSQIQTLYSFNDVSDAAKSLYDKYWLPVSLTLQHLTIAMTLELRDVYQELQLAVTNFFRRQRECHSGHVCNVLIYQMAGFMEWRDRMSVLEKAIISLSMLLVLMEAEWSKQVSSDDRWAFRWFRDLPIFTSRKIIAFRKTTLTDTEVIECLQSAKDKLTDYLTSIYMFVFQALSRPAEGDVYRLLVSLKTVTYDFQQLSNALFGIAPSLITTPLRVQSKIATGSHYARVLSRLQDGLLNMIECGHAMTRVSLQQRTEIYEKTIESRGVSKPSIANMLSLEDNILKLLESYPETALALSTYPTYVEVQSLEDLRLQASFGRDLHVYYAYCTRVSTGGAIDVKMTPLIKQAYMHIFEFLAHKHTSICHHILRRMLHLPGIQSFDTQSTQVRTLLRIIEPSILELEDCNEMLPLLFKALAVMVVVNSHHEACVYSKVSLFGQEWVTLIIDQLSSATLRMFTERDLNTSLDDEIDVLTDKQQEELIDQERSWVVIEWIRTHTRQAAQRKAKQLQGAIEDTLLEFERSDSGVDAYLSVRGDSGYPVMAFYSASIHFLAKFCTSPLMSSDVNCLQRNCRFIWKRLEDRMNMIYSEAFYDVELGRFFDRNAFHVRNVLVMSLYDQTKAYLDQAISICKHAHEQSSIILTDVEHERVLLLELMATLYCDVVRVLRNMHDRSGIIRNVELTENLIEDTKTILAQWPDEVLDNNVSDNKPKRLFYKCQLLHRILGIRSRALVVDDGDEDDDDYRKHFKSLFEVASVALLDPVSSMMTREVLLEWIEVALSMAVMDVNLLSNKRSFRVAIQKREIQSLKKYVRWFVAMLKHFTNCVGDAGQTKILDRLMSFVGESKSVHWLQSMVGHYESRFIQQFTDHLKTITQKVAYATLQSADNLKLKELQS